MIKTYGKNSESWIGKKVGVYTETIKGNEAIRIREAGL